MPHFLFDMQHAYLSALGTPDLDTMRNWISHNESVHCCQAQSLDPLASQLEAILVEQGPDALTLALLGQIELERHSNGQARVLFAEALEMDRSQLEALTGLAQLALAEGQHQEYQKYRFLIERHPALRWFHLAFLARAQHQLGNQETAIRLIEQAYLKHPPLKN
ncbi:tetratricopeptide repeat protein [Ferrimonas balearica]|uniref:tetratricopeptide repeat protein n=1 Tax=Ferrimonas balearica TaxID=44012 RepID=UPI001C9A24B6|nr:hypothetical protein [Ferrimonas balearica]MBY5920491.1 hypothetical protein [Ferrimonas balearica]MBY5996824.1 hypothetical protein [Ferrimonas balearica]